MPEKQNGPDRYERRKTTIPPGDPFVRHLLRMVLEKRRRSAPATRRKRRGVSDDTSSLSLQRQRRNSILVGTVFLLFALVVYIGLQGASPKLRVDVAGAGAIVLLDGAPVGRSGELLRSLPSGKHIVRIIPDEPSLVPQPSQQEVDLQYSLVPVIISFRLVPAGRSRSDSTTGKATNLLAPRDSE